MLSVTEAARQKKVSEATLRAAVVSGELPAVRTGDGYTIPAPALSVWEPKPLAKPVGEWTALAASTATDTTAVRLPILGALQTPLLLAQHRSLVSWLWIVAMMAKHVIPALRGAAGDVVADAVANLIAWLDGKVVLTRHALVTSAQLFAERVRSLISTFRWTNSGTATAETRATIRVDQATVSQLRVETENIPREELPDEVQNWFNQNPRQAAAVDVRDAIRRVVIHKGAELGVTAEELTLTQ
jgi:excisionase family DNA binding protein